MSTDKNDEVGAPKEVAEKALRDELLMFLAQTGSLSKDEPFFNKLARYLAQCPDMDFVCICHLEGDALIARTVALWCDGHFEDNIIYALKDTPCGIVVGKQVCCFPARVCQLFPHDQILQRLEAQSYVGVTLWSHDGAPIGLIAVISRRPLKNREQTKTMIQLVATRASAELERMNAGQTLHEKELELEEAQLLADTGSWTYEPGIGRYTWSQGMYRIWGLDPASGPVPFTNLKSYVHPDDYPRCEAAFNDAVERGVPYHLELRINRPDGAERIIVSLCKPESDPQGRVVKLRGSHQDITDRRRAEEKLRERDERLHFFFEYVPAALAMFDSDMRYLYLSERWRCDYGLKNRDLIGLSHYEVFPEISEKWKEAHRLGLAGEVIRAEADPFERLDGFVHWIRWEIRPWYRLDGKVGGIVIFTEDITDRKRAEDSLRKSEYEFRMLAESMPQIVWVCSPDGLNTYFNQQWVDYTGLSLEESYGHGWIKPFHPEDRLRAWNAWQDAVYHGTTYALECRLRRADGAFKWWLLRSVPVRDDQGTILKWFGTCTDIDELKRAEEEKKRLEKQFQQAQKLESLGVLAGGIAHDFNNILAVIMGHCSLAQMDYEKAGDHIPEIEKAAVRAADLCRQMLAYAGKAQLFQSEVNIGALVEEMVKMLRSTIKQNVVITADLPADGPIIKADSSQVRQVVMNLVINAAEAIGEAQGEVRVVLSKTRVQAEDAEVDYLGKLIPAGVYARLEVTDNGCGMDEETYHRLFEPFYSTKFSGRGLGMSAVLGIINAHSGRIQLSSQLGKGTTFKVYFPAQVSLGASAEPATPPSGAKPWRGSGTILLVEDEEQIIVIAESMLKNLGFRVITARNGLEALELYRKNADKITLVITDIGMPIMDGFQTFRELKKLKPELAIIVSSGFGDVDIGSRLDREEIAGSINKPYSLDQLRDLLREVFDKAGLK